MKKMKTMTLIGCAAALSMTMASPVFADETQLPAEADTSAATAAASVKTNAESVESGAESDTTGDHSAGTDTESVIWDNLAVANVTSYANIRNGASIESEKVGELYPGNLVKVEGEENGWTEVSTGEVDGYIRSDLLLTGDEAKEAYYAETENSGDGDTAGAAEISDEELKLLAAIIHCEAGGEIEEGKIAVGAVVLNRVESSSFPNNIHDVIYQSGQFTPAMTGWLGQVLSGDVDADCYAAAKAALAGQDPTNGCLYFHAGGGSGLTIGNQTFY